MFESSDQSEVSKEVEECGTPSVDTMAEERAECSAETDQAGHVGEVTVPQRRDEVVHQAELGRLTVDVGRDEEEAGLGTQHSVGRQQVLAGAALRTQHVGGGGGEGGQEDEEEGEERARQRGDDVHGCAPAATQEEKKTSNKTSLLGEEDEFLEVSKLYFFIKHLSKTSKEL